MNLLFDRDCCICCGACARFCPGHVLALDDGGEPYERYPDDCWYCGVCQVECPENCITILFPYMIR